MARKKPGPKGTLKNPRPVDINDGPPIETVEIDAAQLDSDEHDLRDYLLEHRRELLAGPREPQHEAIPRITRLALDALTEVGIWWSGDQKFLDDPASPTRRLSRPWGRGGTRRHVGPTPPAKFEDRCLWLDTSGKQATLKQYHRASKSWATLGEVDDSITADAVSAERFVADMTREPFVTFRSAWPRLSPKLRASVTRMLTGRMGRAGRSGRPAYLACATLAALLDTTPKRIMDLLANYRRRPRTKRIHR
jgi:hypothetical protein